MSELGKVVAREIKSRDRFLRGTVISDLKMADGDDAANPVWVVDVEIGSNRHLQNCIVKAGADGSRMYARQGFSVMLHSNAQGRYDVVGPGDLLSADMEIRYYDLDGTQSGTAKQGFSFYRYPFSYYQTIPNPPGTASLWADGVTPFPLVEVRDADGNPVS